MDNITIIIIIILIIAIGLIWYNHRTPYVEGMAPSPDSPVDPYPTDLPAYDPNVLPPSGEIPSHGYNTPSKRFVLYLFYSPRCGASREILPVWKNVVDRISNSRFVDVVSVDVDDPTNKKLTFHYGIEDVPTIIFSGNRGTIEYTGPRDPQKILDFVRNLVQQGLGKSVG